MMCHPSQLSDCARATAKPEVMRSRNCSGKLWGSPGREVGDS